MNNQEKINQLIEAGDKATCEGFWQTRFIYRLFSAARAKGSGIMMFGDSKQDWSDSEFITQAANTREAVKAMAADNELMREQLEAIDRALGNERNEGNTLSAIRLCVDAALKGKDDE